MEDICVICSSTSYIASADVTQKEKDIGGNNMHLVCQSCFDSSGRTNMKQKRGQEQPSKRKQLEEHAKAGQKKARKKNRSSS